MAARHPGAPSNASPGAIAINKSSYKPDLGTHLLAAGVQPANAIWLENVPLTDIAVLTRDSFTTMLHFGWDQDLYAASLDFDIDIFRQLMEMVPPGVREKWRSIMVGRSYPFRLELPAPIVLNSVECVLGSAVQTQKEAFVPLTRPSRG